MEHMGSWSVLYGGDNYSSLHLYRYPRGWEDVDASRKAIEGDQQVAEAVKGEQALIQRRSNQFMKNFAYWPQPRARTGANIYDVRAYRLKACEY